MFSDSNCIIAVWKMSTIITLLIGCVCFPHVHAAIFNDLKEFLNFLMKSVNESETDNYDECHLKVLPKEFNFHSYQQLEDIYGWFDTLEATYPGVVQTTIGGKSFENRDIKGVKVSFRSGNPGVFLEGGLHGREWIAPATVTYILHQLLTSNSSDIRHVAENYDWYVFPICNPDGYVYSQTFDRLWRKNRRPNGLCSGVDLNRNWNISWNEVETKSGFCAEDNPGTEAFSEIETKSLSEYISSLNGKIHTYLSFHSYSQMLLYPNGYSCEDVKNFNELEQIANASVESLTQRHGTAYRTGSICSAFGVVAGNSIDWVYSVIDSVSLAFVYELRPNEEDSDGFIIPAEHIVPVGEETFDSIVRMLGEARKLGYFK